jgi:hypothetical protein
MAHLMPHLMAHWTAHWMFHPSVTPQAWAAIAAVAVAAAGGAIWYARTRKSPEERERLRRMLINSRGRIAEGSLMEFVDREGQRLLVYEYSVAKVTYNAAQDISTILETVRVDGICDGLPARIKYDPQNPSDSIVVCEKWSGL